jgi:hypothetical protein
VRKGRKAKKSGRHNDPFPGRTLLGAVEKKRYVDSTGINSTKNRKIQAELPAISRKHCHLMSRNPPEVSGLAIATNDSRTLLGIRHLLRDDSVGSFISFDKPFSFGFTHKSPFFFYLFIQYS